MKTIKPDYLVGRAPYGAMLEGRARHDVTGELARHHDILVTLSLCRVSELSSLP